MRDFDAEENAPHVSIRNGIVQAPSRILYEPCEFYNLEEPGIEKEIMRDFKRLSGLLDGIDERAIAIAANQGGLRKAMFVHRLYHDYVAVVNPTVTIPPGIEKIQVATPEGCLSHRDDLYLQEGLFRYPRLIVDFWEYPGGVHMINRRMDKFEAQMFQHEIDHLLGVTIVERVNESIHD